MACFAHVSFNLIPDLSRWFLSLSWTIHNGWIKTIKSTFSRMLRVRPMVIADTSRDVVKYITLVRALGEKHDSVSWPDFSPPRTFRNGTLVRFDAEFNQEDHSFARLMILATKFSVSILRTCARHSLLLEAVNLWHRLETWIRILFYIRDYLRSMKIFISKSAVINRILKL